MTKIIKRYANRKLYDTEQSTYVTLDEIEQMIKDAERYKNEDEVRLVLLPCCFPSVQFVLTTNGCCFITGPPQKRGGETES